jgi:hypothetical protein
MKQLYLILIIWITATTFGFSQSTDKQNVLYALNQMAVALRTNNSNALYKLYADDYTSVSSRGIVINKVDRIASIRSGQLNYQSFNYKDAKIRIYGNTAVINATIRVKIKGKEAVTVLSTLTLVKNAGYWQIVAAQSTNIQ